MPPLPLPSCSSSAATEHLVIYEWDHASFLFNNLPRLPALQRTTLKPVTSSPPLLAPPTSTTSACVLLPHCISLARPVLLPESPSPPSPFSSWPSTPAYGRHGLVSGSSRKPSMNSSSPFPSFEIWSPFPMGSHILLMYPFLLRLARVY